MKTTVKTNGLKMIIVFSVMAVMLASTAAQASVYNSQGDYSTDQYGDYWAVTGGLFPTGDTFAGGTAIRSLTDDPVYWNNHPPIDAWQYAGWNPPNGGGIALTLKNGASIVYDNNGLETGSVPAGYYAWPADNNFPTEGAGVTIAYNMSNNRDWIYAGAFQLGAATTVTQLSGYFVYSGNPNDATNGFDPNNPVFAYHENIFSNVAGATDMPANTGSFAGDVFSSDTTAGTFSWSDTGYDRIGSTGLHYNIYSLDYTLAQSITLQAGTYWFSSDASIVPEPGTLTLLALGALTALAATWIRRRR
ncbi:MAG: PEP-CTERM sorting domain-containing protein [Thermoguttaceae bacterium]